jgi:hypothetical protein
LGDLQLPRIELATQRQDGSRQFVALNGFTRGLAHDEHFLYVGESANRKADDRATTHSSRCSTAPRSKSSIASVSHFQRSTKSSHPDELAGQIAADMRPFQVEQGEARIAALETQVELGFQEIETLKLALQKSRRPKNLQQALTEVKRSVVRSIESALKR